MHSIAGIGSRAALFIVFLLSASPASGQGAGQGAQDAAASPAQAAPPAAAPPAAAPPANRFEKSIQDYEKRDAAEPPPQDGVVFVGSSSIRLWKLQDSFPGEPYLNRGFGGSQISDSIHFVDRIVTPYRPRVVVFYAGDNDIQSGKSPEQVAADFQTFVRRVHAKVPAAKILFVGIKPSGSRWKNIEKIRDANRRVAEIARRDSRLEFLDVEPPMLGDDGQPKNDLFVADRLHMSAAGYEIWTAIVKPRIAAALQTTADLILHNGKIVTVDPQFTIVEALAVRGDRIVRVGKNDEVLALRGEKTQVIDLAGKMVLPGLIDSHVHASGASMHEFDHPVPDMETVQDVLDYVKSRTATVPEGKAIWVNQIFITRLKEQRYPTKAELDAIAPRHPVVFSTGPDAMVNSLALKLSGIDKDFVVTGAGQIEKDPKTGEPTGMLRGQTKRFLKVDAPPSRATEAQRDDRLASLLTDYNMVGITCVADRNCSRGGVEQYQRLLRDKRLRVRVAISHSLTVDGASKPEKIRETVAEIARHPLCQGDSMLRIVGVKSFLDGGMLTGSAFMRQPWGVSQIYSITDPEYRGVRFIPDEPLTNAVRAVVEAGLQYTAHSVGDGAVHALLDAYEEVNKSTPVRPTRSCLTHSNFMSREAIDKMVALGVVADIQPAWLYLDAHTLHAQFGEDRLRWFQPLRTIFEKGAIAGGGSDHMQKVGSFRSINPYNPFLGMQTAITRRGKYFDRPLHAEESLSREQAIRFYTANNAYVVFLEDQIGSLEPGKLADFIVVDQDLLSCPVDKIRDTRVVATYMNGDQVHAAD